MGVLFVLVSSVLILHQFKQDVLKYRIGNHVYKQYHQQATIVKSGYLPALVITSNAIGFAMIIVLLTIIFIPICMPEFYQFLTQYRTIILTVFLPFVIDIVLSRITKMFGFKKESVKNRM